MASKECRMANIEPKQVNDIVELGLEPNSSAAELAALKASLSRLVARDLPIRIYVASGRAAVCAMHQAAGEAAVEAVGDVECRFCGCTHMYACEGGCEWLMDVGDPDGPVCSAPKCRARHEQEQRHAR
jgi:hypothetical protein